MLARRICLCLGLALLFSPLALAEKPQEITIGVQKWKAVGGTSSSHFADVVYALVSDDGNTEGFPEQYLRVAIAKERATLLEMESQIIKTFKHQDKVPTESFGAESFDVSEVLLSHQAASFPNLVLLTAIQKVREREPFVGVQYSMKPHCMSCLPTSKIWMQRFATATVDESGQLRVCEGDSCLIDFSDLVFSNPAQRGYIRSLVDHYGSYLFGALAGVGSFVFLGGKIVLGALGYNGPCGQNAMFCRCGH